MKSCFASALAWLVCASGATAIASETVSEPKTYRQSAYRAPVPETLKGVTVIDAYTAYSLWQTEQVAFIDVMPHTPKPANLPKGTIWRDKPRYSISGSIWLPDVGYGQLAQKTDAYFRQGLQLATKGQKSAPIVIFCLDDCWMSWNAAKRAREEYGYTQIFWLPEGTDGWSNANYTLERINPWKPPRSE